MLLRKFLTSARALAEVNRLNSFLRVITEPKLQGASQAMLYATGFKEEDFAKAQVGVGSVWWLGNPCNMHLLELNQLCLQLVRKAGLMPMQFNSIGVSDGISMGTDGMRYSLQLREIIADLFETITMAQHYDGNIAIPLCDKNMPGVLMAMGRHNRPLIMVYGGTTQPGVGLCGGNAGQQLDIVLAFQVYGQYIAGDVSEEVRADVVRHACPGPGSCGGMYTANTLALAAEVMGMTLPNSLTMTATSAEKVAECQLVGEAMKKLLASGLTPRDIMTKTAFENAIAYTIVTGGSTNAVLHLLAIAHSVDVPLTIDDFQRILDKTPLLGDFKPSGKHVMADLQQYGGTQAVLKYLVAEGIIDGLQYTVTTKTMAENLKDVKDLPVGQDIIMPVSKPLKPTGHLQILRGLLAPEGAVGKITGKEGTYFKGKAMAFDDEALFIKALEDGKIKKGVKTVVLIRYQGPKGGPGMPEMLKPSSALMGYGLGKDVSLLTDGRFSGGSHGFLIGHIVPEAAEGGPIGLVEDGDEIVIDADNNVIDLLVDEAVMAERRAKWTPPAPRYTRGTLAKYVKLVGDASHGCVLDA